MGDGSVAMPTVSSPPTADEETALAQWNKDDITAKALLTHHIPATFQRFMNNIFHDLLDVCVIIYLDDILIYSKDMSQHHAHVKEVLQRLHAHSLYAGAQKCEFHKDTIEYLGFVVSPNGLHMAKKDKIQSIMDWPEP